MNQSVIPESSNELTLVAFDIETIADPGLPPSLMPQPEDYAAPSTWKDPEKIAAYEEEKKEKIISRFGLSPMTGKILMAGFLKFSTNRENDVVEETIYSSVGMDYREFLQQIANYLDSSFIRLVTYNGKRFDIPFLMVQFALNNIKCSTSFTELMKKYQNNPHWDLFTFLGEDGRLSQWASRFGGQPHGTGAEVTLLYHQRRYDEIRQHLSSDLKETARIARALAPYL